MRDFGKIRRDQSRTFIGFTKGFQDFIDANFYFHADLIAGFYGFRSFIISRNYIHHHASHQTIGGDCCYGIFFYKLCCSFIHRHFYGDLAFTCHFNFADDTNIYTGIPNIITQLQTTHITKNRVQLYVFTKKMLAFTHEVKRRNQQYCSDDNENTDTYFFGI